MYVTLMILRTGAGAWVGAGVGAGAGFWTGFWAGVGFARIILNVNISIAHVWICMKFLPADYNF